MFVKRAFMNMTQESKNMQEHVQVKLNLTREVIEILDKLKIEYGVRTRARVIEILLQDLVAPEK